MQVRVGAYHWTRSGAFLMNPRILITHPKHIERHIDRWRIYGGIGVQTVYDTREHLIDGAQPVDVVLTYTEPPEELHGFYFPDHLQFMDLP